MILRYNTITKKYTVHSSIYRTMDGLPGEIKPPFVQLEVIETEKEYNPETENIELDYDIQINDEPHDLRGVNGTATQVWTVMDKTLEQILHEQTEIHIHSVDKIARLEREVSELQFKLDNLRVIRREDLDEE